VLIIKAEIVAIGDELCYGRVYDTNSFWLADQLTRRGIFVQRITCLRDDEQEICKALGEAVTREHNFIFITGGLGPTQDDKTLSALSKLSGKRVIVSETVLKIMSERRNISPESFLPHQLKMISTLEGAECLPNPVGWAPMTILKLGSQTIFVLPGPPKEVQACFNEHIADRIQEATRRRSYAKRIFVTMYESELTPLINEVLETVEGVYLKPLVGEGNREQGLGVEVITFDLTDEGCLHKYQAALSKLKELVVKKGRNVLET
jgi:nicotinamide-nucleotide amidase